MDLNVSMGVAMSIHHPRFPGNCQLEFEGCHLESNKRHKQFYQLSTNKMRCYNSNQRLKISYSFKFDLSLIQVGQKIRFFIPYPLSTEYHKNLKLIDYFPDKLIDCFTPDFGFFYGYEFEKEQSSICSIFYEFEITIIERELTKKIISI